MPMKISFYKTRSGRFPVFDYISDLQKQDRARIWDALRQIERDGLNAIRVRFRQVDGKLWELKRDIYRIFYVLRNEGEILLLHAYKKEGQRMPLHERDVALKRMKESLL